MTEDEIAGLKARFDALRQAAALPGAELRPMLEAAFAELDGAIDTLTTLHAGPVAETTAGQPAGQSAEASHAERRLLRAVFQDGPVPLFLLEKDSTVRRVNRRAGELLGSLPGYATGKPFTAFVDLPSRAAVHTQLAAVVRTGKPRHVSCRLLSKGGTVQVLLTLDLITLAGDSDLLMVAASENGAPPIRAGKAAQGTGGGTAGGLGGSSPQASAEAGRDRAAAGAVEAITQRLDLVTAVTRLLLENATFNESVTLQRCARLLAGEFAAWVIVDVARRQRLRRQFVIGPPDQRSAELARIAQNLDPQPDSVPWQVHDSGKSQLLAHAEDTGILGAGPDNVPLLMLLGATSVLSVPLCEGDRGYGALTLARQASEGQFEIADLGLAEELGEQLALAIKVDRMFRRRSEVADALQASLLPRKLPGIAGVDLAAAYVAATEGLDVGGDFYDVYRHPNGWGLAIGDVCGKGEEAAAVTAAARHAIRVLGHWNDDPAEVLRQANEVMLAEEFNDRFVTAEAAHVRWRDGALHVVLASAGHPGPVLVRADGPVRMATGGGQPLGLFPDAEPGVQEFDLAVGDLLFFFTDGVTEARSPRMAYFEDRLTDELAGLAGRPASDVVSAVQGLVLDFCANELRDDMTIMVMRVSGPGFNRVDASVV